MSDGAEADLAILAVPELAGLDLGLGAGDDGEPAVRCAPPPSPAQRAFIAANRSAILVALARDEVEALDRHARLRLSDAGNAERLVDRYGAVLRHCRSFKRGWLVWDGRRGVWRREADLDVLRLATRTVRGLYRLAERLPADEADAVAKHARRSENRRPLEAMALLAATDPELLVDAADLDADRWRLTVATGTIDLTTGALGPSRPADLATRRVPIAYDPAAACPRFDAFLAEIQPDADVRCFLQRLIGKALCGDVDDQVFCIFWGEGSNGKSTLEDVLLALFGGREGYGAVAEARTFLGDERGRVRQDLAVLAGARLVIAHEPNAGRTLDEALVKQMTGGDPITCRYLFGLEFTYAPLFTPIFVTNHKPIVRGTEHAIWRRLRLVEFGVRIPDERQDKRLKGALHTELPGILAWAVRGCLDWQRDGLPTPEAVRLATADYRADMDAVGQFLAEGCVLADGCRVTASALYAAYKDWIEGIGARPLGYRALRADLLGRGLPAPVMASAGPHKGQMTWRGIGLAAGRTDGPVEEVEEVEEKAEASLVMPAHREPSGNSSTSSTSSTGPVSVRTSGDAARVNGSEPRPGPSGPGPARSFRWRDWSERP